MQKKKLRSFITHISSCTSYIEFRKKGTEVCSSFGQLTNVQGEQVALLQASIFQLNNLSDKFHNRQN